MRINLQVLNKLLEMLGTPLETSVPKCNTALGDNLKYWAISREACKGTLNDYPFGEYTQVSGSGKHLKGDDIV